MSRVDRNKHRTAPYLALVNESIYIGEASNAASFLNVSTLVQIAVDTKCDAVHPG
jgi:biotin carboxylase